MGTASAGNSNLYSKLGDVSKLVSEKSFEPISTGEFNKINENIFSTNSSIDGTYVNGQARLAEIDAVAILTKEQETKEKQDKNADELTELAEFTAQLREEQERSERWLNQQHTYAGLNLSGTEWQAMSRWFQDDDNVAAWEDQIMADTGMSRKDAKRVGGKMKRMYDLIDLQTQGKVLTTEQEKELNDLSNDSDVKKGVDAQQKIQSFRSKQPTVSNITNENETRLDSEIQSRTKSFSEGLNDGGALSAANQLKPLTPMFNQVAPSEQIILPPVEVKVVEIQKIATSTVSVNANDMFGC